MAQSTISTELLRAIKTSPPPRPADYRDPKVPGFVLRRGPPACTRGACSCRTGPGSRSAGPTSLPCRRARAAQHCRARASSARWWPDPVADSPSLAEFLRDHYAPWMVATRGPRSGQVGRIQSAFANLLDLSLAELTTARLERWRAERRYRRRTPGNVRGELPFPRSTATWPPCSPPCNGRSSGDSCGRIRCGRSSGAPRTNQRRFGSFRRRKSSVCARRWTSGGDPARGPRLG